MKQIEVVAAIIESDGSFLATQRGYGDFKGFWEFPGGKIEIDENRHDALIREILEELNVKIRPVHFLGTVQHVYPTFRLSMHCYISEIEQGNISLNEHLQARWLEETELDDVDWLPADIIVVEKLKSFLRKRN